MEADSDTPEVVMPESGSTEKDALDGLLPVLPPISIQPDLQEPRPPTPPPLTLKVTFFNPARYHGTTYTTSEETLTIEKGEQISIIPPVFCSANVTLLEGEAEIFGAQLAINQQLLYKYPQRTVIATYTGCKVLVEKTGYVDPTEIIKDDPFPKAIGAVHQVLEDRRQTAKSTSSTGPKVMVVGPMDSGKSSCCRILLNYATMFGWSPTFVDMDTGQQGISLPGMLSSAVASRVPGAILGGYTLSNFVNFPVGQIKMDQDVALIEYQTDNLAQKVLKNVRQDPHLDASGIIINTAGWIDVNGFKALVHMVNAFEVNIILAMEDAVLGQCFKQWAERNEHKIEVLFAKKPTCLSIRSIETRRNYRDFIVTMAFRSPIDPALPRFKIIKRLDFLVFYQISSYRKITLPNGRSIAVSNQVSTAGDNLKRLLAISSAPSLDVDVKSYPIIGSAVLLRFVTAENKAWLGSTLDMSRMRRPIILLRTEVWASDVQDLVTKDFLYPDNTPVGETRNVATRDFDQRGIKRKPL